MIYVHYLPYKRTKYMVNVKGYILLTTEKEEMFESKDLLKVFSNHILCVKLYIALYILYSRCGTIIEI